MKLRLVLSALVAGVLGSGIAQAAPVTDIVLGNLGASGTNAVDGISANSVGQNGSNNNFLAMAFTTGTSDKLQLQKIQLGLGSPTNSPSAVIKIIADNSGNPSGTVLGTLTTGAISSNALYDFTPTSGITLSAATKYWFVVSDANVGTNNSSLNWYDNFDGNFPTEQNLSGYGFPAPNAMKASIDGGSTWTTFNAGRTAAFNLQAVAVPEPSTCVLAAAGLAVAGFVRSRRRKARA